MIEKWIIGFALLCFVLMLVTYYILSEACRIGKDYIEKYDESEDER